jgi:hypothetical protein
MVFSILHPELLTIKDEQTNKTYFGGAQEWFLAERRRRAGCGPTCAANVLAYLALSRPELRKLYGYDDMSLVDFSLHMEEVYKFVTPRTGGLNRVEFYSEGVEDFAASRGILLKPQVFSSVGNMAKDRPSAAEFIEFAKAGLSTDCPLGFLVLTRGREKNLQGWHWITITSIEIEDGCAIATASDEGLTRRFDLRLWYISTRMRGGLVYFT